MLISLIVALWLSFVALRALITQIWPASDYIGLLSCVGSFPPALFLIWFVERTLKRVWHSGNSLTIDEMGIHAKGGNQGEQFLSWSPNMTNLNWFFQLKGFQRGGHERRVPKQWLCLACQLQLDEERIVAYSFLNRQIAERLVTNSRAGQRFHEIFPADVHRSSLASRVGPPVRPEIPTEVLAGSDGRYWLAERRRWFEGFELTPEDFEILMNNVHSRLQVTGGE